MKGKVFVAIDLKSFYASVECVEKGLDPLNTNLVVADRSRTSKTICLAVSPALKSFGVPGRPRLFEVEQKVKELNEERRKNYGRPLKGKSCLQDKLQSDASLAIDYVVATPRMSLYIEYSTRIYDIYLKYVAKEDMHIYSIDEVFIDASTYLNTYKTDAHGFAKMVIADIMESTGITATAGIGDNLYLAKVAMDIVAKHLPPDENGVRIAQLDERSYREILWDHEPLSDFWRIGPAYQRRLAKYNLHTMGDVARFSLNSSQILYDEFGVNAELLIDHAWGFESCTMKSIKEYRPSGNSLSSGQVLMEPYTYEKALVVCKEMIDSLCLDLVEKGLLTDHVGLYIGYDGSSNLYNYHGPIVKDWYGRKVPKPAGGSMPLDDYTSSVKIIRDAVLYLFEHTVDKHLLIRRINITCNRVYPKDAVVRKGKIEQFDLFSDPEKIDIANKRNVVEEEKEEKLAKAIIDIRQRYGKNMILKGTNFEEGATGKLRNEQIGGHKE